MYGSLFAISITSPPEFLRFSIFDFADLNLILLFLMLFLEAFYLNETINWDELLKSYWFYLVLVLSFTFFIYGFNSLTIRLIFYTVFGFLIYYLFGRSSKNNIEIFFIPIWGISILNFLVVIFELSYMNNTLGWISFFYENPGFFNRGRLAGFQGGGPNVAGLLFIFLTFLGLYFYNLKSKLLYLILTFVNIFLVFITFSRGSYLALFVSIIFFISIKRITKTRVAIIAILISFASGSFLYFGNSQTLLKESDREYLTRIALDNISLVRGYGGGNYVKEIYGKYFLSINPEILENNLNIKLDKVELGITPEEFSDSGVDFFIGTSGGGYELLQQANIALKCSDDRTTCQHVRVDYETLYKFLSSMFGIDTNKIKQFSLNSNCFSSSSDLVTRGEFDCLLRELINSDSAKADNLDFTHNEFFVQCEITSLYKCEDRQLAIGELAVLVEKFVYDQKLVSEDSFKQFCKECKFRDVNGYIKIQYDKYDRFLPRSTFSFYTSDDGYNWSQIGFSRSTGKVVNFNQNSSYIEIGGHSDGQSYGNTYLDATVKSLEIISNNSSKKIIFSEEYQNNTYFVFKPSLDDFYRAKITYEDNGIKLYRPNKYWLAIDNNFNFSDDFELILEVSFPEIPWETNTLISSTSTLNGQIQSWRVDVNDGRLFFKWADQEGVFTNQNTIGDKSLRSGILIQQEGKISSTSSPIVDPSYLSQLTTAHNGYLTFAVEYGLLISILFFGIIFKFTIYLLQNINNHNLFIALGLIAFLVQNITNDMIYSPDVFLMFNLFFSMLYSFISPLSDKKL
jgi:hypothetical protein